MEYFNRLIKFLDELEQNKIYYDIKKIRDGLLVEIVVPGERWEVEYLSNGEIIIEKFKSDGNIFFEDELKKLIEKYSL